MTPKATKMNHFTITDIEQLTGIKAHTLRVWENRYQFFPAKRKDGGHRFYDGDDLKRILRISRLYHYGHKISTLLLLEQEQLQLLDINANLPVSNYQHRYVHPLLDAVKRLDEARFNELFEQLENELGMEQCMLEAVYPLLRQIGDRWLYGKLIPAQEHFCSELVMRKLIRAFDALPLPDQQRSRQVVLFTPVGETHEIPLHFMRYLLKKNGHTPIYLGKEMAVEDLMHIAQRFPTAQFYFHLITHLGDQPLNTYISTLLLALKDAQLVIAGAAITEAHIPDRDSHRVVWLRNSEDMRAYAVRGH